MSREVGGADMYDPLALDRQRIDQELLRHRAEEAARHGSGRKSRRRGAATARVARRTGTPRPACATC
ncbi:MAG TPA: hypothetical protein VFT62_10495 [Mycobacteriales bacterium]|nr:hypothetical protein [Mycobacteriales bacterium]